MAKKKAIKKATRAVSRAISVSKTRQQRRAAFSAQPLQARLAAAVLIPQSRRQVGKKIGHHRREVIRLRAAVIAAPNAAAKVALTRELQENVKMLAGLLAVAQKKRERAKRGGLPDAVSVSPTQIKSRLSAVQANMVKVEKLLATLKKQKKGSASVIQHRAANIRLLEAKKLLLHRRLALLKRGLDFDQPVRLHPSRVAIQRKNLTLPKAWAVPESADVTVLIRLLGGQVKRLPTESDRQFVRRLRAFVQRALVRFVNLRAAKLDAATAMRQAAESTLVEDEPAINAEAAAGGVVIDEAAEAMDVVIQPVSDQLEVAVEDLQTEVPAGDATEAEVDEILKLAEVAEVESASAPAEPSDELLEDLESADEPYTPDVEELDMEIFEGEEEEEEEEPLYKNPMVVLGVLGGLGLLWFLSGR